MTFRVERAAPVSSVFSRTGAVVAQLGDYAASLVTNDSVVSGATVKDALDALSGAVSALIPQGNWNASTNTPDITGTTETGYFWIVSVAGNTDLGGITDWEVNDWAVKTSTGWAKVDNTDTLVDADNGLHEDAGVVKLGGALTENTDIGIGAYTHSFTGDVQDPAGPRERYIHHLITSEYIHFGYQYDGSSKCIDIRDDRMEINDGKDEKGLVYVGDYSANYTARSLVDKEYVDGNDFWSRTGTYTYLKNIGDYVGIGTATPDLAGLHIKRVAGGSRALLIEGDSNVTGVPNITFRDTFGGVADGLLTFHKTLGFAFDRDLTIIDTTDHGAYFDTRFEVGDTDEVAITFRAYQPKVGAGNVQCFATGNSTDLQFYAGADEDEGDHGGNILFSAGGCSSVSKNGGSVSLYGGESVYSGNGGAVSLGGGGGVDGAGGGSARIYGGAAILVNGGEAAGDATLEAGEAVDDGEEVAGTAGNAIIKSGANDYDDNHGDIQMWIGNTKKFQVEKDGTLSSLNTSYESLVTSDDDIPNKKYVDDAIAAEDFWQRNGTVISPENDGDDLYFGKKTEQATYPDFSSDPLWSAGSGPNEWTYDGINDRMIPTGENSGDTVYDTGIALTSGVKYRVQITINRTNGIFKMYQGVAGTQSSDSFSTTGLNTRVWVFTANANENLFVWGNATFHDDTTSNYLSRLSVEEVSVVGDAMIANQLILGGLTREDYEQLTAIDDNALVLPFNKDILTCGYFQLNNILELDLGDTVDRNVLLVGSSSLTLGGTGFTNVDIYSDDNISLNTADPGGIIAINEQQNDTDFIVNGNSKTALYYDAGDDNFEFQSETDFYKNSTDAVGYSLDILKSRGTFDTPITLEESDVISSNGYYGYTGSVYTKSAEVRVTASSDYYDSTNPATEYAILTPVNGDSTTLRERFRLDGVDEIAVFTGSGDGAITLDLASWTGNNYAEFAWSVEGVSKFGWYAGDNYLSVWNYTLAEDNFGFDGATGNIGFQAGTYNYYNAFDFRTFGSDTSNIDSGSTMIVVDDENTTDSSRITVISGNAGTASLAFGENAQRDAMQFRYVHADVEGSLSIQNGRLQEWGDGYINFLGDVVFNEQGWDVDFTIKDDDGNSAYFYDASGFNHYWRSKAASFIFESDTSGSFIDSRGYSDNNSDGSGFAARKARGTLASPAAIESGDDIGYFIGWGYDNAGWESSFRLWGEASENWTAAAHGTNAYLGIKLTGETSLTEMISLLGSGEIHLHKTVTVDEDLSVNGGSVTISSSSSQKPEILITNTNDDSGGILYELYKDSASPANGDDILRERFFANNASAAKKEYASIVTESNVVTASSEQGRYRISIMDDGVLEDAFWLVGKDAEFKGNVKLEGGLTMPLVTKTADYTLTDADYAALADGTSNTVEIKLPPSPGQGDVYEVSCINATFACTVGRNGKNINGVASDWTLVLDDSFKFHYDSTYGWKVK
ncbi:MAG: hypothetical protein ACTSW1_08220 [Candidatus Hodarchaeales archaeon]